MLEGEDSADDDGSKGAELFKKLFEVKNLRKMTVMYVGVKMNAIYPHSMEPSPRSFVLV